MISAFSFLDPFLGWRVVLTGSSTGVLISSLQSLGFLTSTITPSSSGNEIKTPSDNHCNPGIFC